MSFLKLATASAALVLLAACSSYAVKYDFDPAANFTGYRSFAWYAASKKAQGKGSGQDPFLDKRVRAAVEQQLQAKGYRLEAQGEPDLLVTFYPVFRNKRVRASTTVGFGGGGWARPWGYGIGTRFTTSEVHNYREGTIILELVDSRSNQLVWQGSAEGALTRQDDPKDAQEQINRAVRDLLDKFPPK